MSEPTTETTTDQTPNDDAAREERERQERERAEADRAERERAESARMATERAEAERAEAAAADGDAEPQHVVRTEEDVKAEAEIRDERSEEDVAREMLLIQSPGPVETEAQGLVRTGRKLPEHPALEDSAGLTPDATAVRVEHTHAQRDETHRVTTEQGHAADGDAPGVREHPRI